MINNKGVLYWLNEKRDVINNMIIAASPQEEGQYKTELQTINAIEARVNEMTAVEFLEALNEECEKHEGICDRENNPCRQCPLDDHCIYGGYDVDVRLPVVPSDKPPRKYIVRRLTPTECARLQGFPDWWCWGLETPDPTEDDIAWAAEVWVGWQKVTAPNTKPKSRNQLIKWLKNPHSDAAEYKLWGNGIALLYLIACSGREKKPVCLTRNGLTLRQFGTGGCQRVRQIITQTRKEDTDAKAAT